MMYKQIKKLCKDRSLSLTDLSRLSKISKSTIASWDRYVPRKEKLEAVCQVLHVDPKEMLKFAKVQTKKCKYCGTEFKIDPHRQSQIYCSEECREEEKKIRLKSAMAKYNAKSRARRRSKDSESSEENKRFGYNEKSAAARKYGINYGLYTAIRDGYLKPPAGLEMILNEGNC